MIEIIKQLLELAGEDGVIRQLQLDYKAIPARIQQLEKRVNGAEEGLEDCTNRLLVVEERKNQAERELEEIRSNIAKSNSKRSRVKTNREYWATMKEVEDLKVLMKTKEEEVLSILEESESLGKEKAGLLEKLEAAKPGLETEIRDLKARLEVAQAEIDRRLEARGKLACAVEKNLLERYEALTSAPGGQALAGVRDGICMACNMSIPPQVYNQLLRNDQLLSCPNCQRIIYWLDHEDLEGSAGQ
ncbi:MAG: hypothetical protein HY788_14175 [Deltaproteobacteria bacterium]|nr:hypothetical protein [Deltaproteobacteria bacterium]